MLKVCGQLAAVTDTKEMFYQLYKIIDIANLCAKDFDLNNNSSNNY